MECSLLKNLPSFDDGSKLRVDKSHCDGMTFNLTRALDSMTLLEPPVVGNSEIPVADF